MHPLPYVIIPDSPIVSRTVFNYKVFSTGIVYICASRLTLKVVQRHHLMQEGSVAHRVRASLRVATSINKWI